jgi:putative flippase GtrA
MRRHAVLIRQLVRFGLVGLVNTGTYYAMYLLFLMALPYLAAHVLAFSLSTVGSFFLNSWFTYRTRPTWRKFVLFPLSTAANFVITTGGVYLMVDVAGLSHRVAPLAAMVVAVPITFLVARLIMLRPEGAATPAATEAPAPAPDSAPAPASDATVPRVPAQTRDQLRPSATATASATDMAGG